MRTLAVTRRFGWQCGEGHEWEASPTVAPVNPIQPGARCAMPLYRCPGRSVLSPNVARELHPSKNGTLSGADYFQQQQQQKVRWQCEEGHEWEASVSSRTRKPNPTKVSAVLCRCTAVSRSLSVLSLNVAREIFIHPRMVPLSGAASSNVMERRCGGSVKRVTSGKPVSTIAPVKPNHTPQDARCVPFWKSVVTEPERRS